MFRPIIIYHSQTLRNETPVVIYHTQDQDAVCDSSEYGLSVQTDFGAHVHGVATQMGAFAASIKDTTRGVWTSTPQEHFRYRYPVSTLLVSLAR